MSGIEAFLVGTGWNVGRVQDVQLETCACQTGLPTSEMAADSWHSDSCNTALAWQNLTACKCTDCYFCKEMFIEILRSSADTLVKRLACLCAYSSNGVADRHLWLSTSDE